MNKSSDEQRLQELISMAKMAANQLTSLHESDQSVQPEQQNILAKEIHLSLFPKHLIDLFRKDQE